MPTITLIPSDPARIDAVFQLVWMQLRCAALHGPHASRRIDDDQRRCIAVAAAAVGWKRCETRLVIATLRTVRGWHRRLVDGVPAAPRGRPRITDAIRDLVICLAKEGGYANSPWGTATHLRRDPDAS